MKTSVEWLFDQINDALIDFTEGKISASIYGIRVTEYKQQAKEMHKQEINDAYKFGLSDEYVIGSQRYYNKTFA
jgi:hypothetical protein